MTNRLGVLVLVCLCLLIGASVPTFGQDVYWEASEGPYGGTYDLLSKNATDLVVTFPLYAGNAHISTDAGRTWEILAYPANGSPSSLLALDNGDILLGFTVVCDPYVCSADGLYRYFADQKVWAKVGFAEADVVALVKGDNKLFAVVVPPGEPGQLYRSMDEGTTWHPLTTEGLNVQQVFIGVSDILFIAGEGQGLFRSEDRGETWEVVIEEPVDAPLHGQWNVTSLGMNSLLTAYGASAGSNPSVLYKSIDKGKTWNQITSFPAVLVHKLLALEDGTAFAATAASGVIYSQDGGETWRSYGDELKETIVFNLIEGEQGVLLASVWKRGLYRSPVHGAEWIQIPVQRIGIVAFSEVTPHHLFAATENGSIIRSADNGQTWTLVGPDFYRSEEGVENHRISSFAMRRDPAIIYAASSRGVVFASHNYGNAWTASTPVRDRLNEYANLTALAIASDGALLAARYNGGVVRSEDEGRTWMLVPDLMHAQVRVFDTASDRTLYAGLITGQIYRSADGIAWEPVKETGRSISDFAFDAQGHVFAVDDGLLRSSDNGETWSVVFPHGINGPYVSAVVSSSDRLFLSAVEGENSGVYRSLDGGETWEKMGQGLLNDDILALAITNDGHLLGGTKNTGVYRTVAPVATATEAPADLPDHFRLEGNHPNPFSDTTKIQFLLAEPTEVTMDVYNIYGRKVAHHAYGVMGAGQHEVDFEGTMLPSGVYLYRITIPHLVRAQRMVVLK